MTAFLFPPEPTFRDSIVETSLNLVQFASKTLIQKRRSFETADDPNEIASLMSQMMLLSASLSVLTLAYITENETLIETSKTLLRETSRE